MCLLIFAVFHKYLLFYVTIRAIGTLSRLKGSRFEYVEPIFMILYCYVNTSVLLRLSQYVLGLYLYTFRSSIKKDLFYVVYPKYRNNEYRRIPFRHKYLCNAYKLDSIHDEIHRVFYLKKCIDAYTVINIFCIIVLNPDPIQSHIFMYAINAVYLVTLQKVICLHQSVKQILKS